jgi:arginyl-tRNA synthetase
MLFEPEIKVAVAEAMQKLYAINLPTEEVSINATRKEFDGDLTVVVFNLAKQARKSPDQLANELGPVIMDSSAFVSSFNVVKGFLNLVIKKDQWLSSFQSFTSSGYPVLPLVNASAKPLLVEYSSPNTNKPLHLGHLRNILLGYSVAEILKAAGYPVKKVNLVNDRGIHICKSMIAWQKAGNGETPESSGMKGDHLVGKYYVEFDKIYKSEIAALVEKGQTEEDAKKNAPIMLEAQEMLRKWEANDADTIKLWETMNSWVYAGFNSTYALMGVDFDKMYYESQTYLLGKEIVQEGLDKGVFYKKDDGSVWVDLTGDGLDHKLLLRGDGTSVYLTQDLGTARLRYQETGFSKLIYVVGNEQDYHFKVLKLAMKKLGYEWWNDLFHLSYAMVDLPSGKMKSREGTVVDADDLMNEMITEAGTITKELGKIDDFDSDEANRLYRMLGLGALKYYILKVDPEKRMLFNPAESIDFNGNTGPFIQYTYARIRSVIRKGATIEEMAGFKAATIAGDFVFNDKEHALMKMILSYPYELSAAAEKYSPAIMANYAFELAKNYNQFYHENPIVDRADVATSIFRLKLSEACADILSKSLALLGMQVPERM